MPEPTPSRPAKLARPRTLARVVLVLVAAAGIALFFGLDLGAYLQLDALKAHQAALQALRAENAPGFALIYFSVYVLTTALSLPGALVLTLAGGALFGWLQGILLVSFASSLGATLALLGARFLFRDAVVRRLGPRLAAIDAGIAREGAWYLLSLRLVPLFPFFLVNLAVGLTRMPTATFYWVSQVGMLPATVVYVYAGTVLAQLDSPADIASPALVTALTLVGVLPLILRAGLRRLKNRRAVAPWRHLRPRRFDRNLIVIGAGAAGLVSSLIAATVKARVTLIERGAMGGDCLNQGCVPSKALLATANLAHEIRRGNALGITRADAHIDFPAAMARVRAAIAEIAPHDSIARYTSLGVECIQGEARLRDPWTVEITLPNGTHQVLTTHDIILATGATPRVPDLPGLTEVPFFTSETVWDLPALPARLLVLGGGPMGCELAQCFARLGSMVTLVQRGPRLLPREDPEVAALVMAALREDGVEVLTDITALRCETDAESHRLIATQGGTPLTLGFDALLCALGRQVRTQGLGLENVGLGQDGQLDTDASLSTFHPSIHVAGDAVGGPQFTHVAAHQAWYATLNALFGRFWRFRVDYSVIPRTTFVDPEVATVGLNETAARETGVAFEITQFPLDELDRAIVDGNTRGFVKILTVPGRDRILGVTVVGAHASEMLAEFTLAMRHGLGLKRILGTVHAYPTYAEAARYAAGVWRRAHAPTSFLGLLARYHAWRRG
jgi:pyruvate/2-oxoglutarate dehydrogenase complex dihydrolipoamide dehydrogenase (E3) component/uncharacterized membrane protein YdjX (TVP38/TMEM64 family)